MSNTRKAVGDKPSIKKLDHTVLEAWRVGDDVLQIRVPGKPTKVSLSLVIDFDRLEEHAALKDQIESEDSTELDKVQAMRKLAPEGLIEAFKGVDVRLTMQAVALWSNEFEAALGKDQPTSAG